MSSDIRNTIWHLAFQFKVSAKHAIRDRGLPLNGMHARMLSLIQHQERCTANQLATTTGRDKAQITRLLKELEDMGLLTRRPHPSDKRSQLLTLSTDGQALMATVEKAEHAVEAQMLKGLSQDEVASFLKLAEKMLNNLQGN
ncbi:MULTISPECIES: MarR family winged helix-turn-helix transcriptional regulator [Spongiibacter]|uniref:MarR family winged helix-turn-helix transcriptional regulator n=1 Tax=Spongiibacter TaxID=630749 RepID=UPI000C60290F|nr:MULTISPECIES: MarR family transcriptional regulator [Spongiibacter]MAY38503.1 MarR family transcriptional regulator [Spongiibacter sp.]MBI59189.1 MarR family transcriptional regulator [Spongiibacter sp.]|tara:strand:+ start:1537 stop:1962 length:426 start_codon:yes stop_codon:yes gene_type:complete